MSSASCIELDCKELPLYICSCEESIYVCQSHIVKHLIFGSHKTVSLMSSVNEYEKLKVFDYLSLKKKLINLNIKALKSYSNDLLKLITDRIKKAQKKLIKEKENLNSMIKALNKTSMVYKEILESAISGKYKNEMDIKPKFKDPSIFLNSIYTPEYNKSNTKDDKNCFNLIFH